MKPKVPILALTGILLLVAIFLAGPAQAATSAPQIVINEVDYDQPSTDTAEYIEIKNVGAGTADLRNPSSSIATVTSNSALLKRPAKPRLPRSPSSGSN